VRNKGIDFTNENGIFICELAEKLHKEGLIRPFSSDSAIALKDCVLKSGRRTIADGMGDDLYLKKGQVIQLVEKKETHHLWLYFIG
jgi:hypothetical protein